MADAKKTVVVEAKFRDKASKQAQTMGSKIKSAMTGPLGAFAAGAVGAAALTKGLKDSVSASLEHESAIKRMTFAMDGDKGAVAATDRWAESMQRVTGISSDVILESVALGKVLGSDLTGAMEMTEAAMAVSASTGRDFNSVHQQLTKTLGGTLGELAEILPSMKVLTAEQLKAGEGAKFLKRQFGDAIEAMADDSATKLNVAKQSFGDLQQAMGDLLLEVLQPLVSNMGQLVIVLDEAAANAGQFGKEMGALFKELKEAASDPAVTTLLQIMTLGAKPVDKSKFQVDNLSPRLLEEVTDSSDPRPRLPSPGEIGFIGPLATRQEQAKLYAALAAATEANTKTTKELTEAQKKALGKINARNALELGNMQDLGQGAFARGPVRAESSTAPEDIRIVGQRIAEAESNLIDIREESVEQLAHVGETYLAVEGNLQRMSDNLGATFAQMVMDGEFFSSKIVDVFRTTMQDILAEVAATGIRALIFGGGGPGVGTVSTSVPLGVMDERSVARDRAAQKERQLAAARGM